MLKHPGLYGVETQNQDVMERTLLTEPQPLLHIGQLGSSALTLHINEQGFIRTRLWHGLGSPGSDL